MRAPVFVLLVSLLAFGCQPVAEPPAEPVPALAVPDANTITARVASAQERLQQSEGGQRVWDAIEAHGGLQQWFANGPLHFRYTYQREGRTPIDTYSTVDTWSSRVVQRVAQDTTVTFGWDGQQAWIYPAGGDVPLNPRFWSLTPYYFVAIPFVFADPGVFHTDEGTFTYEDRTYDLVRITFGENVGDAPDDYYIVFIDQDTNRVGAIRYTVSYPGFYDAGQRSAENFMVYQEAQVIDGITFPTTYRSTPWNDGSIGDFATEILLRDVAFRPALPDTFFHTRAGAEVMTGFTRE